MRPLALVVVLALFAGCAGGGGPDPTPTPSPAPTTAPSPSPSPTPDPTPASPTPASPTPEPTIPPPTPRPQKVIVNVTFDYAREGDATGQSPKSRETQPVPEGYRVVNATYFSYARTAVGPTPLPVSGSVNTPWLRIFDADGTEVLSVDPEMAKPGDWGFEAVPGPWRLQFEGAGTATLTLELTAYA